MQQNLTIMTASAGSGKTYHLTHEYLDLLLAGGPDSHRHILAVTFTNKATAEMKGRIVEALAEAAEEDTPRGEAARRHLAALLHDYGAFGVSTIDAWLQGVMRAYAREAGQDPAYRVELDEDAVLDATTERVLDATATDAALRRRIRAMALRNVEQGRSWNVAPQIKEMARRFLDERFLLRLRRSGSIVTDADAVDALADDIDMRTRAFESRLADIGRRGLAALAADGRTPDSFKGKSRGPMMIFTRWADGEVKEPATKFDDTRAEADGLGVAAVMDEALSLFGEPWREYKTLAAVRDAIPAMALYARIFREMDAYLAEEGTALLRRCGDRLAGLILDGDVPFASEKTGRRIDHMMIDEAQDTSALQWENLRPMVADILARGGSALAVGDAKQAIYRWRGGDWTLLEGDLEASLGGGANHGALKENWRSGRAIVALNNMLFGAAPAAEPTDAQLAAIYRDPAQDMPEDKDDIEDGFARLRLIGGDDWRERALQQMVTDVAALHDEGFGYGRITVLVRKNSEGADAATALAEAGIPVLSDDALAAGSNMCNARIAAALALGCRDDAVTRLAAAELGMDAATGDTLYDAAAAAAAQAQPTDADAPFVTALLDAALDWQRAHGSDIPGFVEWWRKTGCHKSVAGGEGQDAVRVMTIHKAKGLSLDSVVIPFADEPLATSSLLAPTMWCEARGTLAPLGLVPLRAYAAKLTGTQFEEDYLKEHSAQCIDAMNIMYVAMTRARTRLLVYMPKVSDEETDSPARFPAFVQKVLAGSFRDDTYETGTAVPPEEEECAAESGRPPVRLPKGDSDDGRLTVVRRAEAYFAGLQEASTEDTTE